MRLLTFLQSAENQKEITFDAIEKQMQISADDVESFIIEGSRDKSLSMMMMIFFFFSCL